MPDSLTLHAIRAELFDNDEEPPEPDGLLAGFDASTEPELNDLTAHVNERVSKHGNLVLMTDFQIDLVDGKLVNKSAYFVIDSTTNKLVRAGSVDADPTNEAQHWHTPKNEREYERSPQRALWQTARELKWDEYVALNMFRWVDVRSIDRSKFRIYNTLWVYKIKLHADLTFNKLNPRCYPGGV